MKTYLDFSFDEESGKTICKMIEGDNIFYGGAYCHPEDSDFKAKMTGEHIAAMRARIKKLKHELNNVLKPGLAALNQLYFSINRSKRYQKSSYEAKAIRRQIKIKEAEINLLKDIIKDQQDELKNYIDNKEKLYQRTRKIRDKEN